MNTQKPHLPDWLYQSYPKLLITGGTLMVLPGFNPLTVLIGMALALGGTTLLLRRSQYRSHFSSSQGFVNVLNWSNVAAPTTSHVDISWRSSYGCEDPVLDAQHRRIFGMCNQLVKSISTARPRAETAALLEKLTAQLAEHFDTEEQALAAAQRRLPASHLKQHGALVERAQRLKARYKIGESMDRELVGFATYEIIMRHIVAEKDNFAFSSAKDFESSPAARRLAHGATGRLPSEQHSLAAHDANPGDAWGGHASNESRRAEHSAGRSHRNAAATDSATIGTIIWQPGEAQHGTHAALCKAPEYAAALVPGSEKMEPPARREMMLYLPLPGTGAASAAG